MPRLWTPGPHTPRPPVPGPQSPDPRGWVSGWRASGLGPEPLSSCRVHKPCLNEVDFFASSKSLPVVNTPPRFKPARECHILDWHTILTANNVLRKKGKDLPCPEGINCVLAQWGLCPCPWGSGQAFLACLLWGAVGGQGLCSPAGCLGAGLLGGHGPRPGVFSLRSGSRTLPCRQSSGLRSA